MKTYYFDLYIQAFRKAFKCCQKVVKKSPTKTRRKA